MSAHSELVRGRRTRRAATIAKRMTEASRKRTAAKLTGGRSLKPSLMNSHVEPQMQQSRRNTTRALIRRIYTTARKKGKRQEAKGQSKDEEQCRSHQSLTTKYGNALVNR